MADEDEEKFTPKDLQEACQELGMLDFFPRDSTPAVIALLDRMCPHKSALDRLVAELVNHVGKWPGPAEVRGLLCTRFNPADGINHWTTLPGYTAAEAEAQYFDQHQQLTKAEGYLSEESTELVRQLKAGLKKIE